MMKTTCRLQSCFHGAPLAGLVLLGSLGVSNAQDVSWPSADWEVSTPRAVGLDESKLEQAIRYSSLAGGSGMIICQGKVVERWGDQKKRYDIKSATKSFGATMLGVAIKDGKIKLDARAQLYHSSFGSPPSGNEKFGWLGEITIRHLATQSAGFEKKGGYEKLLFKPGTHWHYSDGGPNWLAECITLQYGRDLENVMFERVFSPIGIEPDDLTWRANQYREHEIEGIARREFGAGIHANVQALSRLGYLYLHQGNWNGEQILTTDYIELVRKPHPSIDGLPEWDSDAHGDASQHYGLLWWNNGDRTLPNVPLDAYWAWGLYDSLIVVIPSLDLVIVRGGERGRSWPRREGVSHFEVLKPFLQPIVDSANSRVQESTSEEPVSINGTSPYPASTLIKSLQWAPSESIVRLAKGSDNWPLTWAEDGKLYTAYGDGWGFEPQVKQKLSLGLAEISGDPNHIKGLNVRSPSGEQVGQGAHGKKASGMLMVDGVLYMWVRNANNAQLAWSKDKGKNWSWSDWKWTESFGCPTFLNYGQNYADARDDFVYVYSLDGDSAYLPADRMVMARVPKTKIRNREAYEFFRSVDTDGRPNFTREIKKRGAVFTHRGRCYRSGISYNAGLKRYLWCQTLPESKHSQGPRFQGGFGIYDAPEPWGPWTTVYFAEDWDEGPGETSSLPTKWMSRDGKSVHLVFSGDDHFSVRQASLTTE